MILSSSRAVVPLAALSDWCISSLEIGYYGIFSEGGSKFSCSRFTIFRKKAFKNILAFALSLAISPDPTFSVWIFV